MGPGEGLIGWFTDLSIRRKLMLIMTLLSWGTLLLAAVAFSIAEYLQEKESLTEQIRTQATIIAFNSRAALAFDDPETARRMLSALEANDNIHGAALYTAEGRLFAKFTRPYQDEDPILTVPTNPLEASISFDRGELTLRQPIRLDETLVGAILINAHLDEFGARTVERTVIILAILLVTLSLTFFLALRMQRLIIRPIESLRAAASAIGQGDFDTPIPVHSQDEIGQLALSFRRMRQDLARERAALEQATRAKSVFLANMSHEIRTPMNAIIGLTELALPHPMEERTRSFLHKIAGSSRALLRILNDILDFSKIEAGKLDLEHAPFTLREVLTHLENLFADQAKEKRITLQLDSPDLYPEPLIGDALRLEQVLSNLIGNALKFTEPGDGRVTLTITPLTTTPEWIELAFSIQDTGVGIDPERRDHLFDAFTQADNSITRRYGGSGLGLAICKRLVEMMEGRIEVKSTLGQGSTFRFTARFTPATPGNASRLRERETGGAIDAREVIARIGGARVLLAEDNPINQLVAIEILNGLCLATEVVENGQLAIEKLHAESFDLVLMDLQMPVMDGYAATRALRAEERFRDLPIVAMTAHAMNGDRALSLAHGLNDHLTKPIDKQALHAALLRWIPPREGIGAGSAEKHPAQPVPASETPTSIPGIDLEAALERLNGKWPLLRRMLIDFAAQHAEAPQQLDRLLADPGASDAAFRYIHTFKGMAGNLGADNLHAVARRIEVAIRDHDHDRLPDALLDFRRELAELLVTIGSLPGTAAVVEDPGITTDPGPDRDALISLVRPLAESIRGNDFQALAQLEQLAGLARRADTAAHFERIGEALDRFAFEEARGELRLLAKHWGIADGEWT
ncbi:Sensor histidine kinase RcsC [Candidatus Magnetaquicoccaceae bacterium FCR-1]|uniref:histidine kinase n=1 Tax=Candidatus Magnetaquiglobus chichijimensis TaxID=3141448 RepID=A0ABQ0CCQ4_9PROT